MRARSRTFVGMAIIVMIAAVLMTAGSGANASGQEKLEHLVLVSNSADDTVSVIDFTTREVTATLDVGPAGARGTAKPLGMASAGSTACDVKKPWAFAYTPDSSTIAVAGKGGVDLINSADFPTRVATAAADVTGKQARDAAFAPDGAEGAFTDFKGHELVRFDPATGAVIARMPIKKGGPWGVRYNPVEKGRMAVALNKKNKVACFSSTDASVDIRGATKVAKGRSATSLGI